MTDAALTTHGAVAVEKGRSQTREALGRLLRNPAAMIGFAVLILLILACFLGPVIFGLDPEASDFDAISLPPSIVNGHWFGTDDLGRDLLARTLTGGRVSLMLGLAATVVALGIGVIYGAIAGYVGGWLDSLMMRFVDVFYAVPFIFFVILLTFLFGRSLVSLLIAIGAVYWLTIAVIVRGETLSLKRKEFIEAARAGGMGAPAIILRHIVPNTVAPVIVYASMTVSDVILGESLLSFLGLGVQEPNTSWGVLIDQGAGSMESMWWALVFPGIFLALTLFALNYIADGLRDAFDPKSR
ncbi:MAG TPA: ABC transporter permease subunit [Verrucomicrobiae bacterium]|nr:ABC transporter permease subunit [Verrucomicrobiae bacterium]